MNSEAVKDFCQIDNSSYELLRSAVDQMHLSARAYFRVLKLGRTIADLAGEEKILTPHIAEALQYRPRVEWDFLLFQYRLLTFIFFVLQYKRQIYTN